ncbi:MAG: 4Fe-4S binding protein [Alistipes sp.]
MKVDCARLICFSPTGRSRRVGEAILRGLQVENTTLHDVTLHPDAELLIPPTEVAVIVVPVYGGHVAPVAVERLKTIHGTDTLAVVVAVYGNRAYEKALVELAELAEEQGFRVVAGAAFIGEHSYSTAANPIAAGRPTEEDLAIASHFGGQMAAKLRAAASVEEVARVDLRKIGSPKQPLVPLLRFVWSVLRLRRSGLPQPKTPILPDEERCVHCGICVDRCPVGAIVRGDEWHTDATKCIRCCACVKGCPSQARVFETPFATLLARNFKRQKQPQTLI